MELDPSLLAVPERYKLLIGGIVPRPIALVSTISPDGRVNLAPFSFFAGVGSNPLTLLFCPANKEDGTDKDTLRNCLPPDEGGTGEFVVNVACEPYIRKVVACAEPLAYGESEFELASLAQEASRVVRPPRVGESPIVYECRTTRIVRTNPGAPAGGNVVMGEVVHVFVRDDVVNERLHIDPAATQHVGRMGGMGYCTVRDRFEIPLGRRALDEAPPRRA
ncbi:MAG: flavin reductase family protein [Phycisphaerales bacterium]|jgi:flavin reductase (DIM6/NTAB) family NADH-FMN oxidoreductase RutF|nr:flavin reductase family protein [Phycisphaerales bacterium]